MIQQAVRLIPSPAFASTVRDLLVGKTQRVLVWCLCETAVQLDGDKPERNALCFSM